MKIKIKPKKYYKQYYTILKSSYNIVYTCNKWVYDIASKIKNEPLSKWTKKMKWVTIEHWQKRINMYNYNVKEISKEDVFLELL